MARFEPKSFRTYLQRMVNRVVARTALTDVEEGGALHTVLAAVARELDDQSFQQTNLQKVWDIDTAQGEDLDLRAEDYNPEEIIRRGAVAAQGFVVFSRSGTTGTVTIPAGTTVSVPDGGPSYTTDASGSIPDGSSDSGSIAITAETPGSDGNADANTVTQLSGVSGVETVTNAAAITGGQDEESDAELRSRLKSFARSLSRGTPDALKFAVLDATLPSGKRVVSAEVIELDPPNLGVVNIYIDDGLGTVLESDSTGGTPETVVASAVGGENIFLLDNKPLVQGSSLTVELNASPLTEGTDYTVNRATGQITLDPTLYPTGLSPADALTAEYSYYTGLIAEAQKIVDGDPNDRTNYPGYRAAGTQVFVLAPTVLQQTVQATILLEEGFDGDTVRANVQAAIIRYINGLGVNGDVIFTSLVQQARNVGGVRDVTFTTPTANVVIGPEELARAFAANVDIT